MKRGMRRKIPAEERQVLRAVRRGDSAGLDLLFTQFDPLIQSIVRWPKWNFSEEEQRDVCQNIHMNLQSALPGFKQQCSLRWFVKRIAMHQCIDEIRRQKRWRTLMTPLIQQTSNGTWNEMEYTNPSALNPHDEIVRHERHQSLYSALERVHRTCRESISMFYLQHMSYKDMSDKLGISVNTVGSRLAKCLSKLQTEIKKQPSFEKVKA